VPNKIGVFCPTLNVYGGGEYVAIAIANTLAENGHQVILFSSGKINPQDIKNYFGENLQPNIETLQQPTLFTPRGLADFYQTIIHSYIAKSKCRTFIDAFSNCVFPWTEVTYIHFPYLNQHVFNRSFPYLNHPRIGQAGILPQIILEKNLVNYKKRLVLANSYYTADEIQKFSGKSVEVLYPPFSPSILRMSRDTATKKRQENLVITISRLDGNKQLERIPQIATQTDPSIQFAIIGRLYNQSTLNQLQALTKKLGVASRVHFYPNTPAEQKIELLKKAKIYLHTMVGEHFGISIVEAMALGCLPIVHDSGGIREFVPLPYRYETIEQAATKINQEICNWSKQKAAEVKAIADRFSFSNFSTQFMEFYSKHYD
jgi:glycosyltransferase involved in cell wall biosynthesis